MKWSLIRQPSRASQGWIPVPPVVCRPVRYEFDSDLDENQPGIVATSIRLCRTR